MRKDWEDTELGQVCEVLDKLRKPITKRNRIEGEFPYYGATGILDYINDFIFSEKLVLIGEDGAKWGAGERSAFIAEGKYWVNNHAHVIRPREDKVIHEWLVYFLNFSNLIDYITGLTVPKLNQAKLCSIKLPIPPLPEQKRIVSILDKAFAAIDKTKANAEQNLNNAKELFENYLQGVFNNGHDWENATLGQVCSLITDGKHGNCKDEENSGFYFLSAKDVRNDTLLFENGRQITESDFIETHRRTDLKPGDICLINTGATIGRMAFAPEDDRTFRTTFQKSVAVIKTIPESINNKFCAYLLKADLKSLVKISAGTAVPNLLLGDMKKHKISLPKSLKEQEEIVERLDLIYTQSLSLQSNYQRKLNDLEELKKSILHKAFNGEL